MMGAIWTIWRRERIEFGGEEREMGEELFSLFSVIAHTMPSAAATIARNAQRFAAL